jgi:DNA-binding NtrC family response regulator
MADGGTLFLDEVAEMSLNTQVKLLRFLQDKSFERVGNNKKIVIKTRVIAATNQDIKRRVEEGAFREDLYYRLAVFPITIPPLRERKEDIPVLCVHFLNKYKKEFDREVRSISPEALGLLTKYSWPGNVRELENAICRAMVATESEKIDVDSLPEEIKCAAGALPSRLLSSPTDSATDPAFLSYEESTRRTLQNALDTCGGDIPKAAKQLQLARSTFYRMVKKYGLKK